MKKSFILKAENGLHARPATNFVKFTSALPCDVKILFEGKEIDAKSIMAVMSIALQKGSEFVIEVRNGSENDLVQIEKFLKDAHLI